MKKTLLILCALLLTAVGAWADDYTQGDVAVTNDGFKCTIKGENLVTNGSFEDSDMTGWAGGAYTGSSVATLTEYTRYESGGYDDGAYVEFASGGASAASTPHQAIAVTEGATYLFIAYTSGTTPEAGNLRYSALFELKDNDGTLEEVNHTVGSTSYGNNIVTLEWGADAKETSDTWTKTTGIFTATTSYVGIRMGWSGGSYDGFQLYEVEDVECEINGLQYKVNSANMVSNHSFECDYENWTSSNDYSTQITSSNFSVKNEGAQNGAQYLVGTADNGWQGAGSLGTAWDIEAGKTYYFSYWIKQYTGFSSTTTGYYIMTSVTNTKGTDYDVDNHVDKEGAHLLHNFSDGDDPIGTDWQKVEVVYTNGTGDDAYKYLQVNFRWLNNQFAFDNFQLYEVDEELLVDWEMTDAGWGTLILPFDVDDEEVLSGLTLYAGDALDLSSDGTTITVGDASETITANTPYLVSGTANTYSFTGTPVEAESLTSGLLTGTLVDMEQDDFPTTVGTVYVLQNQTNVDGLAFYPITSASEGVTLDAYHCYLTLDSNTSGSGVRAFISLPDSDDVATAIEAVESETLANDAIYDLSGRRVAKAVKGVYIQNGKKVLVK